jgi:hypothetical protein
MLSYALQLIFAFQVSLPFPEIRFKISCAGFDHKQPFLETPVLASLIAKRKC